MQILVEEKKHGADRLWRLSDAEWEKLAPHFPAPKGRQGFAQKTPNRNVLEAVLYRLRTGCPWRDLPKDYGRWHRIYMRWNRWVRAGVPARVASAWPELTTTQSDELATVFIDSTVIRAHQQAAGARKKSGPQALGRSRGGFGTKLHLAGCNERRVLAAALTPGQHGDAPVGEVLLQEVCRMKEVKTVCGDRACDSNRLRALLRAAGKRAAIPPMKHRRHQYRYGKTTTYRERNRIERLVNRLKGFRALATRYEKLASMFMGLVTLALAFINL